MARYDVYRGHRASYLLDCQADLFRDLETRFVVPLLPEGEAPIAAKRLNPRFEIEGKQHVMMTQYAGAVEVRELGPKVTSLSDFDYQIGNALDLLITGV
jgi:toxin CcdB